MSINRGALCGLAIGAMVALAACGGATTELPSYGTWSDANIPAPAAEASRPGESTGAAAAAAPVAPPLLAGADGAELAILDPRSIRQEQRADGLLVTVIQQSEELLRSEHARAAVRPLILRRLAEDYVELRFAALREASEAATSGNAARARAHAAVAAKAGTAAIRYYTVLLTEHAGEPSRADPTNLPLALATDDEVRYDLALQYIFMGDAENARRVLYSLIQRDAASRYVSRAYLLFAELFAAEGSERYSVAQAAFAKAASVTTEDAVKRLSLTRLAAVAKLAGDTDAADKALAELSSPSSSTSLTASSAPSEPVPAVPAPSVGEALPASSCALVVGVERYRHVSSAAGAAADAAKMADTLTHTFGVGEDRVRVLVDDRAARSDVLASLEWLAQCVGPVGRAYVFFSGHGAEAAGAAYILPYDGSLENVAESDVSVSLVAHVLGPARAHDVFLMIDTINGGVRLP